MIDGETLVNEAYMKFWRENFHELIAGFIEETWREKGEKGKF